ncbi:MAG: hypothetical protein ACE5LV_02315 [Candidatus Aminicenantales bacterium]
MTLWIHGIKGLRNSGKAIRMVLLLYGINLLFSLILAVPMYHSLEKSFGNSLVGERMAKGFDYLWWEEFRDQARGLEKTFSPSLIGKGAILHNLEGLIQMRLFRLPPQVVVFLLLYVILHTFLAGGVLTIFATQDARFGLRSFFGGAGSLFPRFLSLMLLSWVFFLMVGRFIGGGFAAILENVRETAFSEITPFYLGLVFSALMLFFFLIIQMVFDYARVTVVLENSRNIFRAAAAALRFVLRHPGAAAGLFFSLFLVQVLATGLYVLLHGFVPQTHLGGVLAGSLIQQGFIGSLVFIRCWLYASELELYRYYL